MDFVDAPPDRKRRPLSKRWVDVVAGLHANPHQWANVGRYSPGIATSIRRGRYPAFTLGKPESMDDEVWIEQNYEITTRKCEDGSKNDIYIRYIG